MNNLRTKIWTF